MLIKAKYGKRKLFLLILSVSFLPTILHAQTHEDQVYTIIGDGEIVNNNAYWDADAKENDMVKEGDLWQLTVKNVLITKTDGYCHSYYHFAVIKNRTDFDSPYNYLSFDENNIYQWGGTSLYCEKTGIYNIIYTYKEGVNEEVKYRLILVEERDDVTFNIKAKSNDSKLGSVTGGGKYSCGDNVVLKATPAIGCTFVSWSNGSRNTELYFVADRDTSFAATFAKVGYSIIGDGELLNNDADWDILTTANDMTLNSDGEWELIVKNRYLVKTGSCCHDYYYFAAVQNHDKDKAFPYVWVEDIWDDNYENIIGQRYGGGTNNIYVFSDGQWDYTGGIEQTGMYDIRFVYKEGDYAPTAYLTMIEALDNPTYTLKTSSNDAAMGSVSKGGTYECGTWVEIKATPNDGYRFDKWSDNGSTYSQRSIEMCQDKTIQAQFSQKPDITYTVVGDKDLLNSSTDWDANNKANEMTLNSSGQWELTIKNVNLEKTGYYCHESYSFAIAQNNDINNCIPNLWIEEIWDDNYENIIDYEYHYGSESFWEYDDYYNEWSYRGEIEQSGTYDITFIYEEGAYEPEARLTLVSAKDNPTYKVTLTVNDPKMGTVSGNATYECGTYITIEATPSKGYMFVNWSDGNKYAKRQFSIGGDITLQAVFAPVGYTVIGEHQILNGDADWDPANTANDMTLNDEGIWELKINNVYLERSPSGCHPDYRYAVASNHSNERTFPQVWFDDIWDENYENVIGQTYSGGGVYTMYADYYDTDGNELEWGEGQTGIYNIIFTYKEGDYEPTAKMILVEDRPNPHFDVFVKSADATMGSVEVKETTYDCDLSEYRAVATAKEGYRFVAWSDGNTSSTRYFSGLTHDTTIVAYFEEHIWTVIGDADLLNGQNSFDPQEQLNDLIYDEYYDRWQINLTDKALATCYSPYRFRIVHNRDLSQIIPNDDFAYIEIEENGLYDIDIYFYGWKSGSYWYGNYDIEITQKEKYNPDGLFTISLCPDDITHGTTKGDGKYVCGQTAVIEALPNEGYKFKQWSDGNTEAKRTINANGDISLTAIFVCISEDCSIDHIYLDYDAKSLPANYKDAQPKWMAYPPQLEDQMPAINCDN